MWKLSQSTHSDHDATVRLTRSPEGQLIGCRRKKQTTDSVNHSYCFCIDHIIINYWQFDVDNTQLFVHRTSAECLQPQTCQQTFSNHEVKTNSYWWFKWTSINQSISPSYIDIWLLIGQTGCRRTLQTTTTKNLIGSITWTNKQTKTVWRDSLDSAGRRRPTLSLFQRRTKCRRAAAPPCGGTPTHELRPPPPEEQYCHVTANTLTNTILLQTWKILHLKT